MPYYKNLVGQRFGKLTVINKAPSKNGRTAWTCKCDCGNIKDIVTSSLNDKPRSSKSCGCVKKEKTTAKKLIGQTFNRLTVISRRGTTKNREAIWNCKCSCGNTRVATSRDITSGEVKSCGCWQKDFPGALTHGMNKTSEYNAWSGMKNRCNNINTHNFSDYGARGITVCDRWIDSFENFIEDMGKKPTAKHSIDRIDNNGNYTPENCRWATNKIQQNNKRTNIHITHNGETLTIAEWADKLNIKYNILHQRLFRNNWSIDRALKIHG